MGKFDTAKRIQRGIQPGLAPIAPNMGMNPSLGNPFSKPTGMPMDEGDMGLHGQSNNLLSPSFSSVMNQSPDMTNSVNKRVIGTRPSFMSKLSGGM